MSEGVLAAIISGAISLIGIVVTVVVSNRKMMDELDKRSEVKDTELKGEIAVIKTEIADLRKSQDKHNNMIDRMYGAEKDIARVQEQMKVANHRIDDLEKITTKA